MTDILGCQGQLVLWGRDRRSAVLAVPGRSVVAEIILAFLAAGNFACLLVKAFGLFVAGPSGS